MLTKLTASRISDVVIVDNSAPVIQGALDESKVFKAKVTDKLSVISRVEYTINSSDKWIAVTPEDGIYDATVEEFKIVLGDDVKPGEHILSLKAVDAAGNTAYRNFKIEL